MIPLWVKDKNHFLTHDLTGAVHVFTVWDPILNDEFSEDTAATFLVFVPAVPSTIPGIGKVCENWTGDRNRPSSVLGV